MKILATSLTHDSSACFLQDGKVEYWCKQERLSRIKRHAVPFAAVLEIERRFDLSDVDAYVSSAPFQDIPDDHLDEAAYFNWYSTDNPFFNFIQSVHPRCKGIELASHHLAHASNAFYGSGFDEAYVLVVDRNGSIRIDGQHRAAIGVETETLYHCRYPCQFDVVYRNPPQWVGITGLYALVSERLGIGELENGKTMALAAYGNDVPAPPLFEGVVPAHPCVSFPVMNGRDLHRLTIDRVHRSVTFRDALPVIMRNEDLAYKVQKESTEAILRLIREHVDFDRCPNFCFTGGHAHNCLLNYEIARSFSGIRFYVDPLPDDSGTSLGAAKYMWFLESRSMEKIPLLDIYGCGLDA
jgi:carbamoyltransferase